MALHLSRNIVIQFTTAPAGTGKTWLRCAWFISEELLPQTKMRHISNFPYDPRVMAKFASEKHGLDYEECLSRLEVIPDEVMQVWASGESGPWEYFHGRDLTNCHIAIDEIHNFASKVGHKPAHLHKWQKFLGEIRHRGATFEAISQAPKKVAECIQIEAGAHRRLISSDERMDPFFDIPLGDWYQLRAKFITKKYLPCVFEQVAPYIGGPISFKNAREARFWLTDEYFKLYNSYSAPIAGGVAASGPPQLEWQRFGYVHLLVWFVSRNFWALVTRSWPFILCIVLLCGGGGHIIKFILDKSTSIAVANSLKPPEKKSDAVSATSASSPASSVKAAGSPGVPFGPGSPSWPAIEESNTLRPKPVDRKASKKDMSAAPPTEPADETYIIMIAPDYVLLKNNEILGLGDSYNDKKLESIDVRAGVALFGSVRVRLGASLMQKTAPAKRLRTEGDYPTTQPGAAQ